MNTTAFNQASSELKITEIIKLNLDGQKRFSELSQHPPAPTSLMEKLENLPDFVTRES